VNKKIKSLLLYLSGCALPAGALLYATTAKEWGAYLYAVAAAGMALYYLTNPYRGENKRYRRLHGYLVLAGLLLVASSFLMFRDRQEWLICLLVSAVLQLYVTVVRRD
jgi:energy-converting hydrogenase Eha subunit G